MDTVLPQKFPFILDRNLAKANCTGNRVYTSGDIVVLDININKNEQSFVSKVKKTQHIRKNKHLHLQYHSPTNAIYTER